MKRKKRGMSNVIGSVMLVLFSLVLAMLVFIAAKNLIGKNRPPLDCENTNFRAEVYNISSEYYANIVNDGYIVIEGILVKDVSVGTITILEENDDKIDTGKTKTIRLDNVSSQQTEILLIPIIASIKDPTNQTKGPCEEEQGIRIRLDS